MAAPTIWVLDDNTAIRRLLRIVLERAGYQVNDFESGNSLLESIEEHGHVPNLVISDIEMPGMDGIALVRALRNTAATIPALFISGRSEPPVGLNNVRFLRKPFDPRKLETAVDELLDESVSRHKSRAA